MTGGERGFVLVAVLVVVAVVATLSAAALLLADGGKAAAQGYAAEIEGGHAADAGVALTAVRMADADATVMRDVSPASLDWSGWTVEVRVEDEATKADLNRGDRAAALRALSDAGIDVASSAVPPGRRLLSVDDLAGLAALPAAMLPTMRRVVTVYGAAERAAPDLRSPIETYRIVATARRGTRWVTRWAIVRISPGFGTPFEWLERGSDGDVTDPSSRLSET